MPDDKTTPMDVDKMTPSTTPYYPDYGVIPIFITEPETEAYIVGREPVILRCGAMEADRLLFVCNNVTVPKEKQVDVFTV